MKINEKVLRIASKIKNGAITAGKAFAGGLSGAIIDTFVFPAGVAYYGAKNTYNDIKALKNSGCKDKHLWKEAGWHLAITVLSPGMCLPGFPFGAIYGAADAMEDGITASIKDHIANFHNFGLIAQ